MEEISKFLRLLRKHRLTLIIVPLVAIIITFFLVRNLPDTYLSQSQIATGIVDNTQQLYIGGEGAPKAAEVGQEFSNLVEMMRMKRMLDQVSYRLIIHDLTSDKPFRKPGDLVKQLSKAEKDRAIALYKQKLEATTGLNLWDKQQKELFDILRSMKYDNESLRGNLRIYRAGDSDFINVDFESENSELSAFVANTLTSEFISYYTYLVKTNQRRANNFLDTLLQRKNAEMNQKVAALRDYKIRNRVLNLDEQSRQLYGQILDFDTRHRQAQKDIASYTGALNELDRKFEPSERRYLEATISKVNQRITRAREELKQLSDLYIQSQFDDRYKTSIDSLQQIITGQINQSTDQYIYSPLASKQELVQQRINLEVQLDLARYGIGSLEREETALNSEFDKLVPHEAVVQSLERDVDVASQEYLEVLNKYNQSNMEAGFTAKLSQVQMAMPGLAKPSKKMLLVILSGIVSFVFCVVVLFILFFLDNRILSARELAQKTNLPVLGSLNLLKGRAIDIRSLWESTESENQLHAFRDELRSIRFEVSKELQGKALAITSIADREGKTLLAVSLAFAWQKTNKRVLLIDGSFHNPKITRSSQARIYLEDIFTNSAEMNIPAAGSLTVLGNKGGDLSILEVAPEQAIRERMEQLKQQFDVIIIETASLSKLNRAKEWILFADSTIAVFESNQHVNDTMKQHINYLRTLDKRFGGWVFNKA